MSAFDDVARIVPRKVWDGITVRAVHGEQLSLAVVELAPGAVVGEHSHYHEQLGLVLRGSLRFRVGSEERELRAGQTWEIPSNTPHRAEAGPDGATVLDLFAPPRSEWRGRDLLLRGSSACARRYAGVSFAETWESVWQAKASRLMLNSRVDDPPRRSRRQPGGLVALLTLAPLERARRPKVAGAAAGGSRL